jgi:hypothetical protein
MNATHVSASPREPLTDVQEVKPLNEKDQQLFNELYEVLNRHGALKRFGITLLHQHFEVADDEVLLEQTDRRNRRQVITPIKILTLKGMKVLKTAWRLDTGKAALVCVCVVIPCEGGTVHDHTSAQIEPPVD